MDKSPVCIKGQAPGCSEVDHIAFEEVATGRLVNTFPPLQDIGNGLHEVKIKLSPVDAYGNPLFAKGRFRLKVFDVSDIWENMVVDVPAALQKEFEIY